MYRNSWRMYLNKSLSCNDISIIKKENVSNKENVEKKRTVFEEENVSEDRTY